MSLRKWGDDIVGKFRVSKFGIVQRVETNFTQTPADLRAWHNARKRYGFRNR